MSSSKIYRNQKPLREVVGSQLRSRIFNGTLRPGDRLVERDLADLFSVSRLPVREALRTLQNEGLVEALPSRGVVVATLSRREVTELFEIREALEVLAVRDTTIRISNGSPDNLKDALRDAHEAVIAGDDEALHAANSRFHDDVIASSENHLLQRMLEPVLGRLHWLFRQVLDLKEAAAEHEELYEAILSGDPERAAFVARAHVLNYRLHTLTYLFEDEKLCSPVDR